MAIVARRKSQRSMRAVKSRSLAARQRLLLGCLAFCLVALCCLLPRMSGNREEPVAHPVSGSADTSMPKPSRQDSTPEVAVSGRVVTQAGNARDAHRGAGVQAKDPTSQRDNSSPAPSTPAVASENLDTDNPDLATGYGQMLSMLHSVELGDDPPPFPMPYGEEETGNEDFFVSETNVIVIGENDTPADERRKEAIAWAKVDIGEYIRAGGRAKDALSDIYAYQKECAKLRIDASDDFRAWLTEHPEEADEVLAALADFNTSLRKEGIKELSEEEIQPFNEKWEER